VGAPPWCVVVVRGWIDGENLKVRLLASGDVEGEAVCGSVAAASEQLAAWLSSLDEQREQHRAGDGSEMFD
jgi:hypothetical protein